jgi:hypothetical protein
MKKEINENGLPSAGSIVGMGNVVAPTETSAGSGDKFSKNNKEKKKNFKSYKEFLKILKEMQTK